MDARLRGHDDISQLTLEAWLLFAATRVCGSGSFAPCRRPSSEFCLPVSISTTALMPARSVGPFALSSIARRTGMRCTILTQLPVAFCAGRTENSAPDAGLIDATCALH